MEAGRLDKRVTIQEPRINRNSLGEPETTWTTVATVWASVEPLQGREFWSQQQVQSEITTRIRIRHLPGVTAKSRILYSDLIYNIRSMISPRERGEELQLMCTEGVNDG